MLTPLIKSQSLSDAHKQLLHQQTISENSPGAILHDFQILLELLQPNGSEVSGVNNLLPVKSLTGINQQLSHPIDVKLSRPLQKSYPYINGLYLLLRTSGLTVIGMQGKKQILTLDPEAMRSWEALNPTERYFNLLEIWLCRVNPETIGDYYDPFDILVKVFLFWSRIPDKGAVYENYQRQNDLKLPELYNVALLELFGFIAIETGKTEDGKGWRIKRIKRLPFGDAMMALLSKFLPNIDISNLFLPEKTDESSIAQWQEVIQPYFPEWQNNLAIGGGEFQEGTFIFKVTLAKAWRRIAIPAQQNLDALAVAILHAFNFACDHLYEFIYKDRFGIQGRVGHPYLNESPSTEEMRVGDLALKPGDRMIFHFDFGDDWEFLVVLEQIEPGKPKGKKSKVLESHGKAPEQYPEWDEEDED
jgi:hypothetical protein